MSIAAHAPMMMPWLRLSEKFLTPPEVRCLLSESIRLICAYVCVQSESEAQLKAEQARVADLIIEKAHLASSVKSIALEIKDLRSSSEREQTEAKVLSECALSKSICGSWRPPCQSSRPLPPVGMSCTYWNGTACSSKSKELKVRGTSHTINFCLCF